MEPKHKKLRTGNYKKDPLPTTQAEVVEAYRKKREETRKRKEEKLIRQWEQEKLLKEEQLTAAKEKEEEEKQAKYLGRHYTVSIALPGSILDNAQSRELRSYLAGQIARAAVIFKVDEIVVFDETNSLSSEVTAEDQSKQGCLQLQMILEYLECPQYLRKAFFKHHGFLQYAGLLNPLDSPHHMRATDDSAFREGVVLKKPLRDGQGSYADVGLYKEVQLDKQISPGMRVTVKMDKNTGSKKRKGEVVSPDTPREERGLYWGYQVRLARSLGQVITECPYDDGYDLTIGTSERGDSVESLELPAFNHALVVFGGLHGLEASLEADPDLTEDDPSLLFHHYINSCSDQGSRTIRTEEAILITMVALKSKMGEAVKGIQTNGQS
ncbi:putative methyltransferase C9orf114 [Nucella lapillus]